MKLIKDHGCISNIEVIDQLVALAGQFVIDAGCGDMTLSCQLAEHGARVLAIDPDPVQAARNQAAEPFKDVEFVESGADQLPAGDESVDGVIFSYSLHHIPQSVYGRVFQEVFRVLRPDGFLCVIEPTACLLNDVMKLFHNEDLQRAAAWQALEQFAIPAFGSVEVVRCHSVTRFDSFEQFVAHFASRSFNSRYTEADVRKAAVAEAFQRLGGPHHQFESHRQVMYLHGLREVIA